MKFEYTCKFCHRPGFVITGDDATELEAARRWFPMLCCNRCGDFRTSLRKLREAIRAVARQIAVAPKAKRNEAAAHAEPRLELITKHICTLASDFYRVQNIWDREFVDMIVEKPDKCDVVVSVFIAGIRKISKNTNPQLQ